MATFTSYDQVGIKEDVSPVISNVSPTDTPFTSDIGSEKITQRVKEWQEDSLRAPQSAPVAEGADATDSNITATVMRTNYTQIFMDAFKVAGSADVTDTYGRAKESAYQLVKTGKQLKRDVEYGFVGTAQAKVLGDNATPTARKFDGFQKQVATANVVYTGVGPAALDEAHFLTALQKMFDAGTDPTVATVTSSNSLIVAAFAKASGRYRQINDQMKDAGKVVNVVDLYVSPFGQVKVKINRWQKSGNTLIYNPEMWKKLPFRNWTREPLAKTGDSTRQMLVGEFSLKHANQLGSAVVVEGTSGF